MADTSMRDPALRHEQTDVSLPGVVGFGGGLLLSVLMVCLFSWLLFSYLTTQEALTSAARNTQAVGGEERLPPEPRLQIDPRQDLRVIRAQEEVTLNTYGWVDRNNGTVRIPIREAMRLTVQRGLPTRPAAGDRQP